MEASSSRNAKKSGGGTSSSSSNPNLRFTPNATTPSLPKSHCKPPTGSISSATKQRPATSGSGATAAAASGSGPRGAGPSVKLKQNLFPINKNPTTMKIKTSVGVAGSGSGPGGASGVGALRPPMSSVPNLTSNNNNNSGDLSKTVRAAPEAQNPTYDADEEILDSLYTRYLQLRLLAQIAARKHRSVTAIQTEKLTAAHINYVMDKKCFEAQYRSLVKIEKQVEHLNKIEALEQDLIPLLMKICSDAVQPSFSEFEQKLSEKLDVIPFPNRNVEVLNCEPLLETNAKLEAAWTSDDEHHPLSCLASAMKNREELQHIYNSSLSEEKEVNDEITKLISLKICKNATL